MLNSESRVTEVKQISRLFNITKKSLRLIRAKNMSNFRFAGEGVFDAQGNIKHNPDLDKLSFYGFDGVSLEKLENMRVYVDYDDIPENAKKVFLLFEDERFYHHIGVDFFGIARAIVNNITGGSLQGASTITMQLVKILFLNEYSPTVQYKLVQMYLALVMEWYYSKDQILELYINTIFFGNHAYGMAAASRLYFNKQLKQLSLSECIYLLIIAQRPGQCNPYQNAELVEHRRKEYIKLCYRRKKISDTECEALLQDVPEIIPMRKNAGNKAYSEIYTVRFCENTSSFAPEVGYVYKRLKDAGFADSVIAGIMGNIHVESGFDPQCNNFWSSGLCQWNGERLERLKAAFPHSYTTTESQVDFLLSECDETSPNADSGAVEFYRHVQEDAERTASYYSDLFQALVERNLHQDHYDDCVMITYPTGEFPVYNRLSHKPNEYDGLYYLDATRRRCYAEIYLECMKQKHAAAQTLR